MAAFGGSSGEPMRDFYEVLGITDRRCSEDDIKKAYKKAAMKWHPDKNIGNEAEATERFKEVRHAYSVLSDARERQWYDTHRDEILGGGQRDDSSGDEDNEVRRAKGRGGFNQPRRRPPQGPNIMRYYAPNAFNGYDDGPKGFYTVFTALFSELNDIERQWHERESDTGDGFYTSAPGFGRSNASTNEVQAFYQFWTGFVSCRSFAECDRYNPNDAEDRRVRRAMESENTKHRRVERTKLQGDIRDLAQYLRRRDPRVAEIRERQRQREEEEAARKAEGKRAKAEAYERAKKEWRAAEERKYREMAEEEARHGYSGSVRLADLESDSEDNGRRRGKKGKRKGKKKGGAHQQDASSSDTKVKAEKQNQKKSALGDCQTSGTGDEEDEETAMRALEEEARRLEAGCAVTETDDERGNKDNLGDSESEPDFWRCEICGKDFKSEKQFANHLKSKAHKKKVAELMAKERAANKKARKVEQAAAAAAAAAAEAAASSDSDDDSDQFQDANGDEEAAFQAALALSRAEAADDHTAAIDKSTRGINQRQETHLDSNTGHQSDCSSSSTSSFDDTLLIGGESSKKKKGAYASSDDESDDDEFFVRMAGNSTTGIKSSVTDNKTSIKTHDDDDDDDDDGGEDDGVDIAATKTSQLKISDDEDDDDEEEEDRKAGHCNDEEEYVIITTHGADSSVASSSLGDRSDPKKKRKNVLIKRKVCLVLKARAVEG